MIDLVPQRLRDLSGSLVATVREHLFGASKTQNGEQAEAEGLPDWRLYLDSERNFELRVAQQQPIRESALAVVQQALNDWRDGKTVTLALTGPAGSGKTATLGWLQDLADVRDRCTHVSPPYRIVGPTRLVHWLGPLLGVRAEGEDPDDFIVAVAAMQPRIVMIDNLELLNLRDIGGGAAIQFLLRLIGATRNRHLWIVSVDADAWRRIDFLFGLRGHFNVYLELAQFSDEEIAAVLETSLGDSVIEAATELEQVEDPARHVREKSVRFGAGNLTRAFFYWQKHCVATGDGRTRLLAPVTYAVDAPDDLAIEDLLALVEIYLHRGLDADELSRVLLCDRGDSELRLRRLQLRRLVFAAAHDDSYAAFQINPLVLPEMRTVLRNANLLY